MSVRIFGLWTLSFIYYIEFALAKKGKEEKENQDPIFRKFEKD